MLFLLYALSYALLVVQKLVVVHADSFDSQNFDSDNSTLRQGMSYQAALSHLFVVM